MAVHVLLWLECKLWNCISCTGVCRYHANAGGASTIIMTPCMFQSYLVAISLPRLPTLSEGFAMCTQQPQTRLDFTYSCVHVPVFTVQSLFLCYMCPLDANDACAPSWLVQSCCLTAASILHARIYYSNARLFCLFNSIVKLHTRVLKCFYMRQSKK